MGDAPMPERLLQATQELAAEVEGLRGDVQNETHARKIEYDALEAQTAALRRRNRLNFVLVVALVLAGVGVLLNFRADQREADRILEARCRTGNENRQIQVRSDVTTRSGFVSFNEALLAAFDVDPANLPPSDTEEGQTVRDYLATQATIVASFDDLVDEYTFRDCNEDGDIDTDDGFDPSLPPFEAQP